MINELKKSLKYIFYERISNPLSGAFFLSWFIWNWRILYCLFYSDSTFTLLSRLFFIKNNYINFKFNLIYPLISTVFFILVYPIIASGALWIWLRYKYLQNNIKNTIEKNQLLTLNQSIELRIQIKKQEETFKNLIESKEIEIDSLNSKIEFLTKAVKNQKDLVNSDDLNDDNKIFSIYDRLKNDQILYAHFKDLSERLFKNYNIENIPRDILTFCVGNNIIEKIDGKYHFTKIGQNLLKLISDKTIT